MLDECDTMELLFAVCSSVAQEKEPSIHVCQVDRTFADGGVRGIVTGSSMRRLVGRTLAKQFKKVRSRMHSISVRFIHESGDRLHWAHGEGSHRQTRMRI